MPETTVSYAGFWRRLGAFILDSLLFFSITTPLLYLVYGHEYLQWFTSDHPLTASYGLTELFINKVGAILVLLFLWIRSGATPGKMLMECRIVSAKDLSPITSRQALIRLFGYLVASLPFYLGFAWMAFDRRKQGLHDKLAGTVVIHDADDYELMSMEQLQRGAS